MAMLNSMYVPMSVITVVDDRDEQRGLVPHSRNGCSSLPGQQRWRPCRASMVNAAISAGESFELMGSSYGMPSTREKRPVCCSMRLGTMPHGGAPSHRLVELVEDEGEHVAGRVLAHEHVEVAVARDHVQRVVAGPVLGTAARSVRCWLSGRKHRLCAPARKTKRASVCGGRSATSSGSSRIALHRHQVARAARTRPSAGRR